MASIRRGGTTQTVVLTIASLAAAGVVLWVGFSLRASDGSIRTPGDLVSKDLGGAVNLAMLAAVVGGGFFALGEYMQAERERSRARRHEEIARFVATWQVLMSPEGVAARRWVIRHIPEPPGDPRLQAPPQDWIDEVRSRLFPQSVGQPDDSSGRDAVKLVLNHLDNLGFCAFGNWLPDEALEALRSTGAPRRATAPSSRDAPLVMWMMPPVVKVWSRLGPYVEHEASRRNALATYYVPARKLGWYCLREWRRLGYPPEETVEWPL